MSPALLKWLVASLQETMAVSNQATLDGCCTLAGVMQWANIVTGKAGDRNTLLGALCGGRGYGTALYPWRQWLGRRFTAHGIRNPQ